MANEQSENNSNFYSQLENLPDIPLIRQVSSVQMIQVSDQTYQISQQDSGDILPDFTNPSTALGSFDSNQVSQNINCSSQALRTLRSNRAHLTRPRKRKGQNKKIQIQLNIKGYLTKNFLPIGKNPHFKWIISEKGAIFLKDNPDVNYIKNKVGISMNDYLYLYSHQGLKDTWEKFFQCKFLHREVMLSRAEGNSKVVFFQFLHRFEEAYKTGVFDHIA